MSVGDFVFHVEFAVRREKNYAWWTDTVVSDVILAPVHRDGALENVTHISFDVNDRVPIASFEELARASKKWRNEIVNIHVGGPHAGWRINLNLDKTGPCVAFRAIDSDPSARDTFAQWVVEWSRGLATVGCDLSIGYMTPDRLSYPRPRPPLNGLGWPLGKLDMYLGRRWHEKDDDRKNVLQRITETSLEPGVRRVVEDDVVRISFECDLHDNASVERARVLGERWLTPLVPTKIEPGWNEHGEKMVIVSTPVNREPFTFYDEDEQIGYWALVRDPDDGSVDEARWQKLAAIARAGALDDGTPIKAVRLIAPVRNEALALLDRAIADGFEMVTYPGGQDVFWPVFRD